jgi:hypothetical protein
MTAAADAEGKVWIPGPRVQAACASASNTGQAQAAFRYRDLEIFILAEARESLGQVKIADQYRRYLKSFYPNSALLLQLPAFPAGTPVIESIEVDPEWPRLVREGVRLAHQPALPQAWEEWYTLAVAAAQAPHEPPDPAALQAFVTRNPAAPLAGWAVYQMLWEQRLLNPETSSWEGFQTFWAQHKPHPLATEASEALDIRWFSPRRIARQSVLLPGWGEETLEPGLRESSQALLSETIYLLGGLGFLAAAQHQSRAGNLTGAIIFFNLLMLNHQTSAEQSYATAARRNAAERRRFLSERLDQPIAGSGTFESMTVEAPPPDPLARDLIVAVGYCWHNAGDAWQDQGLVREDQLENLELNVDWVQSLWETSWSPAWRAGVGVVPHGQWFSTLAEARTDAPDASDLRVTEMGGALEAAGLIRWDWGGPWIQLRLSAGPGIRRRQVSGSGFDFSEQANAWFGTAAIALGGESGVFWQIGFSADDSFQTHTVQLPDRTLSLPSGSQEIHFGLGAYF